MDRLKSEQDQLCRWLSEDPDYILDKCGDILSMNNFRAVEKQTDPCKKMRVLTDIVIKDQSTCESFIDILQQHQTHYKHLQQFFNPSSLGPVTPIVIADKCSVVSINQLTNTQGNSFSNNIKVLTTPDGGSSGLVNGPLSKADYVASGGSVVLAEKMTGCTFNGDVSFSVSLKPAQANTDPVDEVQSIPQGPAVSEITERKTALIDCLRGDSIILQHAQECKVITDVQYQNLKHSPTPVTAATDLLDIVINKGQDTCERFLLLLRKPNVVETYPQLQEIL